MNNLELKIKSKSLEAESKIIRHEERKLKKSIQWAKEHQEIDIERQARRNLNSLSDHRKNDVRNEARATYIARAFLSGKPYSAIEKKRSDSKESTFRVIIRPRIMAMIKKYGKVSDIESGALDTWLNS